MAEMFNEQYPTPYFFFHSIRGRAENLYITRFSPSSPPPFFFLFNSSAMVSSRNCLGLISVAYATLLAMHGTVLAAAIPHDGVIRIVNGK